MTTNISKLHKDIHGLSVHAWEKRGEEAALKLFHYAAKTVPAYKKFLKEHGLRASSIKNIDDFKKVPLMTKENYLKKYSLNELLPHGDISQAHVISTSSGSTGVPFFWPRGEAQEAESALIHELFLTEFFNIDKRRTLFINTFAMGMWVAGTTTYDSVCRIAEKHNMTLVTPGIDLEQILSAIQNLGHLYEQVIIAGYPPFVKDVIDLGQQRGMRWGEYNVRFLFAAESFSEAWRTHLLAQVKSKNLFTDSLNIYGTADALIVAHETPISILIRRLVAKKNKLSDALFGNDHRVPTLAQYNPEMRFFEELPESKLIFTAQSGIPLIRYDIGDTGNIIQFDDLVRVAKKEGIDLHKEIAKEKLEKHLWNFPFVSIYGRDRMTASLYGLKIYPEHVRGALEKRNGTTHSTGRFVMTTKIDRQKNQYLDLNVELCAKQKQNKHLVQHLTEGIVKHLCTVNSEYKRLYEALGERALPKITLHDYQTSVLFSRAGKQKWKV
jgi:phenylacetate-CoA ligase